MQIYIVNKSTIFKYIYTCIDIYLHRQALANHHGKDIPYVIYRPIRLRFPP